jgi:hypothetical protein
VLRPADSKVLTDLALQYETSGDAGFTLILIKNYPTGPNMMPQRSTLLLRLPPGFPDATPDMFWLDPPIATAAGGVIPGTEIREIHLDRTWQRWSRHINGQWRPGIDNLGTYLAYIRRCLDQAQGRP